MNISKTKLKNIILWVLIGVLSLGLIAVARNVDRLTTTKDVSSSAYAVGTINAEGKLVDGTTSICTKKLIDVDGLECDYNEDEANVEYTVYFYDKDNTFLSSTGALKRDTDATDIPEGAESFRIMITPLSDNEVSLFEVSKYASAVTVTIDR